MVPNWVIGVLLNIVGSISINFGTNLLKYVYAQDAQFAFDAEERARALLEESLEALSEESEVLVLSETLPPKRRGYIWYIGMCIFIIGNIINFTSFAYAAQSLLAALEPAFVTNVIFGVILLKQKVSNKVIIATLIIIAGNIIVVIFGNHSSKQFTANALLKMYSSPSYIAYLSSVIALSAIGIVAYPFIEKRAKDPTLRFSKMNRLALPLLYALISGMLGTQSIIFAKSLAVIFHTSVVKDKSQFYSPFTFVVLFLWIVCMVYWLRRMNNALKIFPGNKIIPVLQVVWILFGVLSGGIYFKEFDELDALRIGMTALGLFIVIVGVVLMAPKVNQNVAVDVRRSLAEERQSLVRKLSIPTRLVQVYRDDRFSSVTRVGLNLALSTPEIDEYVIDRSSISQDDIIQRNC